MIRAYTLVNLGSYYIKLSISKTIYLFFGKIFDSRTHLF